MSQHCGKDVWENMIRVAEGFLKNTKWTGNNSITLAKHVGKHRKHYTELTEAAKHVTHEVPNEHSRVRYFTDSITCKDPEILAGLAAIKQDEQGKRANFEEAATFLLPFDPVAKKINTRKNPAAEIGAANAKPDLGVATGKTGVPLRWHTNAEFRVLPQNQRDELKKHQNKLKAANQKDEKEGGGGGKRTQGGGNNTVSNKRLKSQIQSIVAPQLEKCVKEQMEKTNEIVNQVATIQQSVVSAMAGLVSHAATKKGSVGATVAKPGGEDPNEGIEQAKVDLHSLQGILKKSS